MAAGGRRQEWKWMEEEEEEMKKLLDAAHCKGERGGLAFRHARPLMLISQSRWAVSSAITPFSPLSSLSLSPLYRELVPAANAKLPQIACSTVAGHLGNGGGSMAISEEL